MVRYRPKFDYEIVRGVPRKKSKIERRAHPKKPKPPGAPRKYKKEDFADKVKPKKEKGYVIRRKGPIRLWEREKPIYKHSYWELQMQRKNHKRRKKKPIVCRLRPSITPGTVLILLAGRNRGQRVIFIKQLPSGLLLAAGPKRINRIPLRRANQAYVIATSTKLDISKCDFSKLDKIDEKKLFQKPKVPRKYVHPGRSADFFKKRTIKKKKTRRKKLRELNQAVNAQLYPLVRKVPYLQNYLKAKFRLMKNDYPHLMKF